MEEVLEPTSITPSLLWAQHPHPPNRDHESRVPFWPMQGLRQCRQFKCGPGAEQGHGHCGCHLGSVQGWHGGGIPRMMWLRPGGFWLHLGYMPESRSCLLGPSVLKRPNERTLQDHRRGLGHLHWKSVWETPHKPHSQWGDHPQEVKNELCKALCQNIQSLTSGFISLRHLNAAKLWGKGRYVTITTTKLKQSYRVTPQPSSRAPVTFTIRSSSAW